MLNIRSCAYALYKARWIFEHGGENLIANTYAEYCNALFNEDINLDMTFEEYIEEYGFGDGSLYVCYSEFLENEYCDEEYMSSLLPGGTEMYHAWECDTVRVAYDIEWDVDDQDGDWDLPNSVMIPSELQDEDEISNYLSDKYGFCHRGFSLLIRCRTQYDKCFEMAEIIQKKLENADFYDPARKDVDTSGSFFLDKDGEDDLYVEVYKTHYPENPQQECYAVEVYDENSSFIDTIFSENLSLGSLCETLSQL